MISLTLGDIHILESVSCPVLEFLATASPDALEINLAAKISKTGLCFVELVIFKRLVSDVLDVKSEKRLSQLWRSDDAVSNCH